MINNNMDYARSNLDFYLNSVKPDDTVDIERIIIGCMLSDSSCIKDTSSLLPEMFTDNINRIVFVSIKEIDAASAPIDFSTIYANIKQRKIDIPETELSDYLDGLFPSPHFKYYVSVLRFLFLQKQFYNLMRLAPQVLGEKANVNNFFDSIKDALIPLNRAIFDTYDRSFMPHWITNGTTTYKVLKSKFGSGGFVWIDGVAVNEVKLLASGFEKKYKNPDNER